MVITNKETFLKRHNLPEDSSLSMAEMSKLSGIPTAALQRVYNRGVGAWESSAKGIRRLSDGQKDYSNARAGKMSKEQWATARQYAFLAKTKSVYYGADNDIRTDFGLK
jgi:hypothetical protein